MRTILTVLVDFDGYPPAWETCDEECVAPANNRSADHLLKESYGLETFDPSQSKTIRLSFGAYSCDIFHVMGYIQNNVPDWESYTHKEALIDGSVPCYFDGMAFITEMEYWLFSITLLRMDDHPGFNAKRWEWIRAHELGHNYALIHGWKNGVEYKDDTCIMGEGVLYSGAVRYLRGWFEKDGAREDALVTLAEGEGAEIQLLSLQDADPYDSQEVGSLAVATPYDSSWTLVFWLNTNGNVVVHRVRDLYYEHHVLAQLAEGGSYTHGWTTMTVGTVDWSGDVVSATVVFS